MAENPKAKDHKADILVAARARFKLASEAEADQRSEALEDLKFRAGEQWPDQIKRSREAESRPCHVVNRIPPAIRQVTNDQRQNRPAIKVHPVDDKGDTATAKVFQGLIRHIEYNSGADVAYDTSFDHAVTGGFGFFRVITAYCDPRSFDQELLIKQIPNSMSVYLDPSHKEPDGSDINWGFITDSIEEEEFQRQFPKAEVKSAEEFKSIGDDFSEWIDGKTIRIAEYFYKEFKDVELVLLSDATVVEADKLEAMLPQMFAAGVTVVKRRQAQIPVVKWCKLTGAEVLEEAEWLGQWIPIIPVYGETLNINGKVIRQGIVRGAKDPQRMINYWKSAETETIALAPRAPFIGVEGQFEGHEDAWASANTKNHPFLQYKGVSLNGVPVGAPQRQAYEPAVQAITMASTQAIDDFKAATGIFDASMGNRSNETSGIAIQRRNQQAQTSNYHFVDNLTRSLRHTGRILVELIPKIYDTARAARIIGEDGEAEIVRINEVFKHKGKEVVYDLGAGKYDVVIETGPSYATKRQEAAASMIEFTAKMPQQAAVVSDLMVRNMDWPGASEIADRLKKTLPPGVADDKENQQPLPPQVQQQLQQQSQLIEGLTEQVNTLSSPLESKRMELESRERMHADDNKIKIELEMAKMGSVEALAMLRHEIEEIKARQQLIGKYEPIDDSAQAEMPPQDSGMVGPEGALPPEDPTGGFSPGPFMEQSSDYQS